MQSLNLLVCKIGGRGDLDLGDTEKGVNSLYRFWYRFKNQIIQDVPENIAVCEFECRKPHCTMGDGGKCELRLHSPG